MAHFCGIYGIGAVLIILVSQYFTKNNVSLFLEGCCIGCITEYLTSFFVEIFLHTRWWDYSHNILNINGRICLLYSGFWGILTIILVKKINPFFDKILAKISSKIPIKWGKGLILLFILFLLLDCILTCYAQDIFITRMVIENDIEVKDKNRREIDYEKIQKNPYLSHVIQTYWNDEKMIKTFPNMKIEDTENHIIYLDSLLPGIQTYYKKIF